MSRIIFALATLLITLGELGTANAAASCGQWLPLSGGKWFLPCVDDRGRNVCYTCSSQQITSACLKQEGSACAT
jgi:hypothetical protein